jgi:class 3 adenylate cyclase
MPSEESAAAYEIAHVLFVDIVGYSLHPIDLQTELLTLLQKIVRESAEFRRARDQNELISLPTGDGMALVFLRDPRSPVKCAVEVGGSLKQQPELSVRMGIHTGPVQRHADISEGANVVGGGINTAQRVMDCGDAGHILLSSNIADMIVQFSDWRECLQDLGVQEVKHGVKLHLYNLVREPAGNPAIPAKLLLRDATERATTLPERLEGAPKRSSRREFVPRPTLFATVFLVACVLTFGFESWVEREIASGESFGVAQAAFTFSGVYQKIVAAPRNTTPHHTVVVEIDPELDPGYPGMQDLCRQRKTMPVLLRSIAAAMPSTIVIDKFFGQTECPGDTDPDLIVAMSEVSAKLPLIVGRRIVDGGYLEPTLLAGLPDLQDAIVNIDPDTRKLALKLQAFPTKSDMDRNTGLKWYPTLALKAVEAHEKGRLLRRHPRLAEVRNPVYFGLFEAQQFEQLPGIYILCGHEVRTGEDATDCPGSPKERLGALSGKIVLVGEVSRDQDVKTTVVGPIPGVYLQANFIEALLDDRYSQGDPALDYIFGFLFLASIEAILAVFPGSWIKTLAAVGLLLLATLLLLRITISNLHWYVNPLPLIALALLIRATVSLEKIRRRNAPNS